LLEAAPAVNVAEVRKAVNSHIDREKLMPLKYDQSISGRCDFASRVLKKKRKK